MSNIKLIAVDLDGTLLSPDHTTVSAANKTALRRAADAGIITAVASGRTLGIISEDVKSVGVDYYIVSNGAAVYRRRDRERVFEILVPYEEWCVFARLLNEAEAVYEVYCEGESYINESVFARYGTPELPPDFLAELKRNMKIVPDVTKALADIGIEKISVLSTPSAKSEALMRDLAKFDNITMCSSIPGNVELTFSPVSKGHAIAELCRKFGIAAEEVMAFGDSGNDIEMLKFAGWGFAMENAGGDVLAAAKYTAPRYDRDGVAAMIDKYCFGGNGLMLP